MSIVLLTMQYLIAVFSVAILTSTDILKHNNKKTAKTDPKRYRLV